MKHKTIFILAVIAIISVGAISSADAQVPSSPWSDLNDKVLDNLNRIIDLELIVISLQNQITLLNTAFSTLQQTFDVDVMPAFVKLQGDVNDLQKNEDNVDGIQSNVTSIQSQLVVMQDEIDDVKFINNGHFEHTIYQTNNLDYVPVVRMQKTMDGDGLYTLKIKQSGIIENYLTSINIPYGTAIVDPSFRITLSSVYQPAGTNDEIITNLHTFDPNNELTYTLVMDVNFKDIVGIKFESELVELIPEDIAGKSTQIDGFYWLEHN